MRHYAQLAIVHFFDDLFWCIEFPQDCLEEINSRNKGSTKSGSDRYSSQTSYNSTEERREREMDDPRREYLNDMGLAGRRTANVFGPFTG